MSFPPSTPNSQSFVSNGYCYKSDGVGGWFVAPAPQVNIGRGGDRSGFGPRPIYQPSYQHGGYRSARYEGTQFSPGPPVSAPLHSPRRASTTETMNSMAASMKFGDPPSHPAKSTGTDSSRAERGRQSVDHSKKFPRFETSESGLLIGIVAPEIYVIEWSEKYKGDPSLICSTHEQAPPEDTLEFELYRHHISEDTNRTLKIPLRKGWKEGSKKDYTRDIEAGAKEFFKHRYHLTREDQLKDPLEDIRLQASLRWPPSKSDN